MKMSLKTSAAGFAKVCSNLVIFLFISALFFSNRVFAERADYISQSPDKVYVNYSANCAQFAGKLRCWPLDVPPDYSKGDHLFVRNDRICVQIENQLHCWGSEIIPPTFKEPITDVYLNTGGGCANLGGKLQCWNASNEFNGKPIDFYKHGCAVKGRKASCDRAHQFPDLGANIIDVAPYPDCANYQGIGWTCQEGTFFGGFLGSNVLAVTGGPVGGAFCRSAESGLSCRSLRKFNGVFDEIEISKVPADIQNPSVVKVASEFYACAINHDGNVLCWGDRILQQRKTTAGKIERIEVERQVGCALRTDKHLTCWREDGKSFARNEWDNVKDFALLPRDSYPDRDPAVCVLSSKGVDCVGGQRAFSFTPPYVEQPVKSVIQAYSRLCALSELGNVNCWGGSNPKTLVPPPGSKFVEIKGTSDSICGITDNDNYICSYFTSPNSLPGKKVKKVWFNDHDLKDRHDYIRLCESVYDTNYFYCDTSLQHFPTLYAVADVEFMSAERIAYLKDGERHCWPEVCNESLGVVGLTELVGPYCARNDSEILCWNNAYPASLGNPERVAVSTNRFGDHSICTVRNGKLDCWGNKLWNGGRGAVNVPKGINNITSLAGAEGHFCAVANEKLTCWGSSGSEGLGISPYGPDKPRRIHSGSNFDCAEGSNGVVCWGDNNYGQTNVPLDLGPVKQLSLGSIHACAISLKGKPVCWGGDSRKWVQPPAEIDSVLQVVTGDSHSCAHNGTKAWCWGDDEYVAPGEPQYIPDELSKPKYISANGQSTCIIDDNSARCWGRDSGTYQPVVLGAEVTEIGVQPFGGELTTCYVKNGAVDCIDDLGQWDFVPKLSSPHNLKLRVWDEGYLKPKYPVACVDHAEGTSCFRREGIVRLGLGFEKNQSLSISTWIYSSHVCAIDTRGEITCKDPDGKYQPFIPKF